MGNVRGASRSAGASVETPLLVLGLALLLLAMAAYLRLQLRQQRRQQRRAEYLPPLLQATTEEGLLQQIARRKHSLRGFIARLRAQLATREQQLRAHDELEGVVTARAETSRRDDEQWRALMAAGRKLHGDRWTAADGDEPSLRELMETHKDELLAYKRELERGGSARRSVRRESPPVTRRSLAVAPPSTTVRSPRPVPPQWQSTRQLATGMWSARGAAPASARDTDAIHVDVREDADAPSLPGIPRLDLDKLLRPAPAPASASRSGAAEAASASEAAFQRKTRLARMFSRRRA